MARASVRQSHSGRLIQRVAQDHGGCLRVLGVGRRPAREATTSSVKWKRRASSTKYASSSVWTSRRARVCAWRITSAMSSTRTCSVHRQHLRLAGGFRVSTLLGRMPSAVGCTTWPDEMGLLRSASPRQLASITSLQAIYVRDDHRPGSATTFAHLDATTELSREIAAKFTGRGPAGLDLAVSSTRPSWAAGTTSPHVKAILQKNRLQDIIAILGVDELSEDDKVTVARTPHQFLSQNMYMAERGRAVRPPAVRRPSRPSSVLPRPLRRCSGQARSATAAASTRCLGSNAHGAGQGSLMASGKSLQVEVVSHEGRLWLWRCERRQIPTVDGAGHSGSRQPLLAQLGDGMSRACANEIVLESVGIRLS